LSVERHSVFATNFIYFSRVFKRFKALNNENKSFMQY